MKEYRVVYEPTEKQKLFHASCADEVLFGGAAGGGKSRAIVMDALLRCLMYPRTHAISGTAPITTIARTTAARRSNGSTLMN